MNTKAETPSDITTDKPDAASTSTTDQPSTASEATEGHGGADVAQLEMRQVAGLTAGSVMELGDGSFQFRESDKAVGFSLVVDETATVTVVPGSAAATIDEIPLTESTPLGDSVLNVGSACFTVRQPRPEASNEHRLAELEAARRPPGAITVPVFTQDGTEPTQDKSSRFGSLFSRDDQDAEPTFDATTWQFLESIRDTRSIVADRHRRLHPDPEELSSRLSRLDPGLWDRTVDHPMFARFAIAYSTIPWEPRFDEPERIPESLYEPIQEMSCLPWVPITANLLFGPLGIVGGRQATLSCARNAVLSLACLTSPSDIEFSIVTAQGLVEDWSWSSSLPNSLFPNEQHKYCVAIADGMAHFEGAGFSHEAVKKNEMGLVVLAESADDLPDYCGTIIELTPDGQCRVTNHLGEQVSGTPIGVTVSFAASLAGMIRDAVGDGPADDPMEEGSAGGDMGALPTAAGVQPVAEAGESDEPDVWDDVPSIDDLIDLDEEPAETVDDIGPTPAIDGPAIVEADSIVPDLIDHDELDELFEADDQSEAAGLIDSEFEPLESDEAETEHAESGHIESEHIGSDDIESGHTESDDIESGHIESGHTESGHTESDEAEDDDRAEPDVDDEHERPD